MEENRNIAAEIVAVKGELYDIENDIKLSKRMLKRARRTAFSPNEGFDLSAPYTTRDILKGQLTDLYARREECELRLARLEKEMNERRTHNVW